MADTVLELARDIVAAWAQKANPGGSGQAVGKYFGEVYKEVVDAILDAQEKTRQPRA